MNKNILILSIAIILAGIIFGGFYYASEVKKQQSIEKQQQVDLQTKKEQQQTELQAQQKAQQAVIDQNNLIADQKAECVQEAEQEAIKLHRDYCTGRNITCIGYVDGTYIQTQYQNQYDTCLQSKGIE